jgi:hypothetical protein
MNAIGQHDYCLNIGHLRLDAVMERFNALRVLREQEAAHIGSAALGFRQKLDRRYDRILGVSHSTS